MFEATKKSLADENNENTNEDMEEELASIAKEMVKTVLNGLGNEAKENKDSKDMLDRENGEESLICNKRLEADKDVDVTEYMCIEEVMEYTMERDDTKEIFTIVVAGISAVVTLLYYYF